MKRISKNKGWRGFGLGLLFACFASGCIDDFSHPGDDGAGGGGGSNAASCPSICERSKECPESSLQGQDCSDYCAKLDALNRNAGCTAEFAAVVRCAAAVQNFCQPAESDCRGESEDYSQCFTAYCTDHIEECSDAL